MLQVCVGENEVILNFDMNTHITILSDFAVGRVGGPLQRYDGATSGTVALLPLLHTSVVRATATDEGGLLVVFQSGSAIEIFDTSKDYESFWISSGERRIVV